MKKLISKINKDTLGQFFKFAIVGILNTIITVTLFFLLYKLCNIYYIFSTILAYSAGILNSYLWNKYWTFRIKKSSIVRELLKFLTINLIGLGLNTILMILFVEILKTEKILAQIFTVGFVMILNFLGSKFWVFKKIKRNNL